MALQVIALPVHASRSVARFLCARVRCAIELLLAGVEELGEDRAARPKTCDVWQWRLGIVQCSQNVQHGVAWVQRFKGGVLSASSVKRASTIRIRSWKIHVNLTAHLACRVHPRRIVAHQRGVLPVGKPQAGSTTQTRRAYRREPVLTRLRGLADVAPGACPSVLARTASRSQVRDIF